MQLFSNIFVCRLAATQSCLINRPKKSYVIRSSESTKDTTDSARSDLFSTVLFGTTSNHWKFVKYYANILVFMNVNRNQLKFELRNKTCLNYSHIDISCKSTGTVYFICL